MSTVPSNPAASPASTPSKKVGRHFPTHFGALLTDEPQQAASAMKVMSLESPIKPTKKSRALVFEEEEAEQVPEVDKVEDLRTRFVGDLETTEGTSTFLLISARLLTVFNRSGTTARPNETTICIVPYSIPRGMNSHVRDLAQANRRPV